MEAFKSSTLKLTTNNTSKIFQLTSKAISYSKFVSKIVQTQPSLIPHQIDWHIENMSIDFAEYLLEDINQEVLCREESARTLSIAQENELIFENFTSEYQNELAIMKYLRLIRNRHSCAIAILELNNQISIDESIERMSMLAEMLIKLAYCWSFAKIKQKSGSPI